VSKFIFQLYENKKNNKNNNIKSTQNEGKNMYIINSNIWNENLAIDGINNLAIDSINSGYWCSVSQAVMLLAVKTVKSDWRFFIRLFLDKCPWVCC